MSNSLYRVSTANQYDTALRNIGQRHTSLSNLQENLTSGKRVVRPSDDPVSAAQAERAINRLARIQTEQRALETQRNAIAQAEDGTLTDPYGGAADIAARVFRHVGPAFIEDPVRILRVARFAARFGCEPVAWHSGLRSTERRRAWHSIAAGEAKIVVGARSALFLPYGNLGVIIVDEAHELVGAFLQYNDNTVERGLFYQALNVVLEVTLDDELELDDYEANFRRMFGNPRMDAVIGSVNGSVRFFGLTPTSMKLEGLDRHQRLIDSYKKLHRARANVGTAR